MAEDFLPETTSLSVEEGVERLFAASQEQPAEDTEPTPQAEELEAEAEEVGDDQPEVEAQEDDAEETEDELEAAEDEDFGDEELYFDVDGEEMSLSEIKALREGNMKAADYTKKTQALAAERKRVEAEQAEMAREREALASERSQLQEALAALAVDAEPEPNWAEMAQTMTYAEVEAAKGQWAQKQRQKTQAFEAYQANEAQAQQERIKAEAEAILRHRPEWAGEAWQEAEAAIIKVAEPYGVTREQLMGAGFNHQSILILSDLAEAKAKLAEYESAKSAVKKKVVKAEPRRGSGGGKAKDQGTSKAVKAQRAKLAKSGRLEDAVALMTMR